MEIAKWPCVATTSTMKFLLLEIVLQEHWRWQCIRGFVERHPLGANGMEPNIQVRSTRNRKDFILFFLLIFLKCVAEVEFVRF